MQEMAMRAEVCQWKWEKWQHEMSQHFKAQRKYTFSRLLPFQNKCRKKIKCTSANDTNIFEEPIDFESMDSNKLVEENQIILGF